MLPQLGSSNQKSSGFSRADRDRTDIARTQSFSEFRDDHIVPLICPTCQIFGPSRRLRRPPATLHGVVFDIFGASRGVAARRHRPEGGAGALEHNRTDPSDFPGRLRRSESALRQSALVPEDVSETWRTTLPIPVTRQRIHRAMSALTRLDADRLTAD